MKNTKKIACLLLCAALLFPASCSAESSGETDSPAAGETQTVLPVPEEGESEDEEAEEEEFPAEESPSAEGEEPDAQIEEQTEEPAEEQPQEEEEETEEVVSSTATYIACLYTGLNIRKGPSTSYTSLDTLEEDTYYPYLGTENGWYKTTFKGQTAYVSSSSAYTSLVEIPLSSETAEAVIQEGYALLGTTYVYGAVRLHDGNGNFLSGFTAEQFDCSSLIQYIFYYGAGVLLNVTTRTQVVQGEYVAKSDLTRGDCIYFTNSSRYSLTGVERVGHVALYLGEGYILHTASDYCKIEKMTQTRWNYYIEARRFI